MSPDTMPTPDRPSDAPPGERAWDQRYAENPWSTEPDPALIELVGSVVPGKALDLGCGPGRNAVWLATQNWDVTGVDASGVGLAQARERAADAGVSLTLVKADLLAYRPPTAQFDLVVIANIHLAPPERERLFADAAAALALGGHLFVVGHHLDSLGRAGPPDPVRLYTEERLRDLFPTLRVDRLERHERSPEPGEQPLVDVIVWATRAR